ncbi:MAG: hypothetical protein BIFFINMI_00148 [Phycisphaerae bacterium]|nr:hypothetical protein [Phycisphaerae bacterium]
MTAEAAVNDAPPPPRPRPAGPLAVVELVAVVLLVLLHEWTPWRFVRSIGQPWPRWIDRWAFMGLAIAVVVGSIIRLRETPDDLGVGAAGLRRGWGVAGLFTGAFIAGVFAIILLWPTGPVRLHGDWVARYVPGLIAQQVALQCFVNNRLYYLARGGERRRRGIATAGAAAIFALLHAPNGLLVAGTLGAGLFWCLHFRRHRNLAAVMASHVVIGIAAMALLGEGPLLHLRVGRPAMKMLLGL